MYGNYVHEAVVATGEPETGITIHYVNENYDEGAIISQHKTNILKTDTPMKLPRKCMKLEYEWLPKVIRKFTSLPQPI